jgi:hypothetical protein
MLIFKQKLSKTKRELTRKIRRRDANKDKEGKKKGMGRRRKVY